MDNSIDLETALKSVSERFNVPIEELREWLHRPADTPCPSEVIGQFRQDIGSRKREFGEGYWAWECGEYSRFFDAIKTQAKAEGLEMPEALERIARKEEPFYGTVSAALATAEIHRSHLDHISEKLG